MHQRQSESLQSYLCAKSRYFRRISLVKCGIEMPAIKSGETLFAVLIWNLGLVKRLMRWVLEFRRRRKTLQDGRVGNESVSDELYWRSRDVAQIRVKDRFTFGSSYFTVSVFDCLE